MKTPKAKPAREDALRNEAQVRKAMVAFIKKHQRPPTAQELSAATGLSEKTVKQHRQRIKLGDGSPNVFQQLTGDVLMALHARAVGYSHKAVKIMTVSQGKGVPSEVQRHTYTEQYPPDATAAKLWMQLVEGWGERQELNHNGVMTINQPPTIIQIARYQVVSEDTPQLPPASPSLLPIKNEVHD